MAQLTADTQVKRYQEEKTTQQLIPTFSQKVPSVNTFHLKNSIALYEIIPPSISALVLV